MLCDGTRCPRPARLQATVRVHDAMHARLLRDSFCPSLRTRYCRCGDVSRPPTFPYSADVVSWYYFLEATGLYLSNLDEPCVKQQNIGRVPRDVFRCAFPLNGSHTSTRITVAVHVEAEFCRSVNDADARRDAILTVVAQQELVLVGPEHTHRAARLASFRQLLESWVVTLRNGDALEATKTMRQWLLVFLTAGAYSVRSIISKPFVQRITILAFKKMRSKDSDGRKKSYDTCQESHIQGALQIPTL